MLLDRVYLGNTLLSWMIAGGVALGVYTLLAVIRGAAVARLGTLASRTSTDLDNTVVEIVRRTKQFFMTTVAVVVATRWLTIDPRLDNALEKILAISVLLQLGIWIVTAVQFLTERALSRRDPIGDRIGVAAVRALAVTIKVVAWLVILIIVLRVFGFDVTTLVTGLGVAGIALALAIQSILGDLLAAVAIVFDRPFDVGDQIAVDNVTGTVEHIGLKTTRLRSISGEQVILPNGDLLKSRIRNYRRMSERRAVLTLDLAYDTPAALVEEAPRIIRAILERQGGGSVRFDRSHFATFTEGSLRIESVYFVLDPNYERYAAIHEAINLGVLREFQAKGIGFAHWKAELTSKGG
jgi:small-conductance mechanosensitive channel